MKKVIIALSVLFSFAASANFDCYRKALNDFSADSASFQINSEKMAKAFQSSPEVASKQAVGKLEAMLECSENAFELEEVSCKEVVPSNELSRVCYVESQHGYFFISMDMMEGLNIVFNRWD